MVTLNSNILTAPGVYVLENTAGLYPAGIASFNVCYLVGTASTGPYNVPTQVLTPADFQNQFGSSFSYNSVVLFFKNHPYGLLYFVRAKAPAIAELSVGTPVTGTYSLTVATTGLATPKTVAYVAPVGATLQNIIDGLVQALNVDVDLASYILAYDSTAGDNKFRIKVLNPSATLTLSALTAPATSTLTQAAVSQTGRDDYLYAIDNAFDADRDRQGFLICPEAFQTLTTKSDRQAVGLSMYSWCERLETNWMALIDAAPTTVTVAQAIEERLLHTPAKGHAAFYYPYVQMVDEFKATVDVPPSSAVAAKALLKYASEGFQEPPAGVLYPLNVLDVTQKVGYQQHSVLNPRGVNCIRKLPERGVSVQGARTCSQTNDYYLFVNTRVIFNVIAGTFKTSFDQFIFSAIDGEGILFTRIKQTAEAILYRLWRGKALYGATPAQAFLVIIDPRNNPAIDLEQGIFRMDVFAVPSPTGERFLINLNRTAIGQIDLVVSSLAA